MRTTLAVLALLAVLPVLPARAADPRCALPDCVLGKLPKGIHWETNEKDPTYADPRAQKGGTLNTYMLSFPLTLRTVGPDSNDSFRPYLLGNQLALTYTHPNTRRQTPGLATAWAYGRDHKTLYYKINPKARWSDGVPVTAYDFAFSLHFYRSKDIVAPWYNDHYKKDIDHVVIYDDHTFAIVGTKKRGHFDMMYYTAFIPLPRHAITLDKDWVRNYNWKVIPNTGPYMIETVDKGKKIVFKRKKDWWAKDLRYFKNRYNVDRIVVTVIRDQNVAWEYFKRGELDGFPIELPDFWHDKAVGPIFDKGYVKKLWFYTDRPLPQYGMWMNMDVPLFKDRNVRLGFQYSMNVAKVLKTVLRGDYERLNSSAEGYGRLTNKNIKARPFDLKLADKYFAKAGWAKRGPDGIRVKDGQRLSALITYGNPAETKRLVVLKEEAKKAGVELRLQQLDSAASFKTMLEKKHEIASMGWAPQERPQYWGQYDSANAHKPQTNNFCNIADPKMDKVIEAYRSEFDPRKQEIESRKIQKLIWDSACYIPTWKTPYFRIAYWRWLKWPTPPGTRLSDDPISYAIAEQEGWDGLYWIDQKAKAETQAAMSSGKTFPKSTVIDKTYRN